MKPVVAFVWSNFGPYHVDRVEAAASALKESHHVVGVELAGSTEIYAWNPTDKISGFQRVTLFPNQGFESVSSLKLFFSLARVLFQVRAKYVFLCHYERVDIYLIAWLLRAFRIRTYLMIESKFDDKPRRIIHELLKMVFLAPYSGALVGGERSRDYLRFLGFNSEKIYFGYDTVSMERIRSLAGAAPAPAGSKFSDRHFTIVARLIPKKNILTALEGYSEYCRMAEGNARELHICGSGELENSLREAATRLDLSRVKFRGFVQSEEVSRALSSTLALILPSVEEQWGLVVNEALAMGVPILCSINVGARDRLVRTALNGYIFEPDNPKGLAQLLYQMGAEESEWQRLARGSSFLAPLGDTSEFGAGVSEAIATHQLTQSYGRLVASGSQRNSLSPDRNLRRYRVVRFWGKPIIAIPEASRDLQLTAMSKYQPFSKKRGFLQQFVKMAIRGGVGWALMDRAKTGSCAVDPLFDQWVADMCKSFNEPDAIATVIWPPQPERKRVYVHLLRPSGAPIAFCKVALNSSQHRYFEEEIASVASIHKLQLRFAVVPKILESGTSSGLYYVAYEPFFEETKPYVGEWPGLSVAVRDYAGSCIKVTGEEIRQKSWWTRFEGQRERCSADFNEDLVRSLANGSSVCRVQGDFVPANLFSRGEKLWICDWEFSAPDGPCKADELCFRLAVEYKSSSFMENPNFGRPLTEMKNEGSSCDELLLALAFLIGREFAPAIEVAKKWKAFRG